MCAWIERIVIHTLLKDPSGIFAESADAAHDGGSLSVTTTLPVPVVTIGGVLPPPQPNPTTTTEHDSAAIGSKANFCLTGLRMFISEPPQTGRTLTGYSATAS
jgi:hypothetical protein